MPSWTLKEYETYKNHLRLQDPKPEPSVQPGTDGPPPGTAISPPGIVVRITSYRRKLLDFDNLVGGTKYLLDGLRFAKLIPDDSPDQIELQVSQVKVGNETEEKTEIELLPRKSEIE